MRGTPPSTARKIIRSQAGATKLEYAVLAGLISVACIAPLLFISEKISLSLNVPFSHNYLEGHDSGPSGGDTPPDFADGGVASNSTGGGTESSTGDTVPPSSNTNTHDGGPGLGGSPKK